MTPGNRALLGLAAYCAFVVVAGPALYAASWVNVAIEAAARRRARR